MNKKIALITLICLSYSPTSDLPSTYIKMTPVLMNLKQYIQTNNIPAFEEATQYNASARHTIVFDFLDAMRSNYNGNSSVREEKAKEINEEFHTNSDVVLYDELIRAVSRKTQDISDNLLKENLNLESIYNLVPLMIPAIFETAHHELLSRRPYLLETIKLSVRLKQSSGQIHIQKKAADTAKAALTKLLSCLGHVDIYYKQMAIAAQELGDRETLDIILEKWILVNATPGYNRDLLDMLAIAHNIGNEEIRDRAFEKAMDNARGFSDYRDIAKIAHNIGNIEMRDIALQKGLDSAEEISGYTCITQAAHDTGNIEIRDIAFEKAMDSSKQYSDYIYLAKQLSHSGVKELTSIALEKAMNSTSAYYSYIEIAKTAYNIGNIEMRDKALDKALIFNSSWDYANIAKIAHNIENEEIRDIAFEKAMDNARDFSDYRDIAKIAHQLGVKEFTLRALEKAKPLVENDSDRESIREIEEQLNPTSTFKE